jgi:hypothetical protein
MAPADEQTKRRADEAVERIRALNEQMLEAGREWSQGRLDAQADFTRQVTTFSTDAARRFPQ